MRKENDVKCDFMSRMTKKLPLLSNEQGHEGEKKKEGRLGFLKRGRFLGSRKC